MTLREQTYDIDVVEAKKILDTARIRVVHKSPDWSGGPWTDPEIHHQGVWKSLCRTDLCDDIATGWRTTKTREEWRAYYLDKLMKSGLGARYNLRRFSIIDAMTDG